jgi:chromosome segregation ATPase
MRKTSDQKKTRILRLIFSGESYGSVAKKQHSSTSTVKSVFDEFARRAEEVSLEEAAEEYQVSEEIEVLRDLAYESRRANVSVPDLLAATRLSALMKKLDLEPGQLKENLNMYKRHKQDFGDFVQAALRLSELETETRETYTQLIQEYGKTKTSVMEEKEKIKGLRKEKQRLQIDVKSLNDEITATRQGFEQEETTERQNLEIEIEKTRAHELKNLEDEIETKRQKAKEGIDAETKKLETLQQKSKDAQQVLDTFDRTRKDLAAYKLDFDDFETVRRFCREIQQLGGDPSKAVEILNKELSLEIQLLMQKHRLDNLMQAHEKEKESHESRIEELKKEQEGLEKDIKTKRETVEKLNAEVSDISKKRETQSADLNLTISALQKQLKDLVNTHADMLQVQPEIDSVSKALPIRRKELEELERKIKEDEMMIAGATAISDFLSKKPSDRDAIITFLRMAMGEASYTRRDELARQAMVGIMVEQGYVSQQTVEKMEKEFKEKVSENKKQTQRWHNIAGTRLADLTEFQNKLQKILDEWGKKMDRETNERIVKLMVEVTKRIADRRAEAPEVSA